MTLKIDYTKSTRVRASLSEDDVTKIVAEYLSRATGYKIKPEDVRWTSMYEGSRPECSVTYEFDSTDGKP